ncbi:TonB-linked outer membrane protein, SusC/RagA family [Chitinophaga ginsengisegetis]|uniref:TonB-linked outer membrane protein, SusC/RagA family n=1 Tax=Chitinophaga ginsengisegetis TaxID=393003 RepID=A0A1T5PB57_9BACT|nr:TonB-dependent receptor [Chitinophaga ginsengisegetis]SKD09951.1 TonB-linked outer membrane protein, SusC/RagA family [Chitinophaga ginsengisegetis]
MKMFYRPKWHLPLLLCMLIAGLSMSSQAQGRLQVTGTVRTDQGELLPNASVVALNEKTKYSAGVVTDSNGIFRFSGLPPEGKYLLSISYMGFETQQLNNVSLKPGATLTFSVRLVKTVAALNDIIVIGYGSARKKDVVGAFNVVTVKEAGAVNATNPSQLLIGKAAGVQVVQNSGAAGADAQIIIRGTGSFTDINPLYVVDGIQGTKNLFNTLNPQDIESITILKDASSTAIYGSAAANGVVIITTKKGKPGPPRVNFTSQWGIAKAWKQLDLLNAVQYVDALKDLAATKNAVLPAKFNTPAVLQDSTNWQDAIFRNALVSEHDLNISGGGEKVNYSVSATYINQQAIITNATNKRFQARVGLEEILGRFRFTQNLIFRQYVSNGNYASIINAIQYAPYKPVLDASIQGGYSIMSNIDDYSNASNPLQDISMRSQTTKSLAFFPQLSGEVRIIDGLKFRSQFAAEVNSNRNNSYQQQYQSSNFLNQARQSMLGFTENSYYMLENYLSYDKILGKHQLFLIAGQSYIDPGITNGSTIRGTGQPNDNIPNVGVASSQSVTNSYSNYARPSVISYYGRLNYTFDDKYILTTSYRRDGASNFGINNRYGNFAAAGLSWRFSEEGFMKKAFPVLSDGKLSASWGQTGNNNIPNFLNTAKTYQGTPGGALVYSFGSTETFVSGTTITTLSNPDLKWEQTAQTDIGIDLAFLNNRLTIEADWYNRKSTGLLVTTLLPGSIGVSPTGTQPRKTVNAADAQNKGFELTIGYRDKINSNFSYNVSVNGSINSNEVLSLGDQFSAPIQAGAFTPVPATTYTAAGYAIGSFYGYRLDHVARDAAEITALDQEAAKKTGVANAKFQDGLLPGDFIYKDINGDGVVNAKDQEILGNAIPKYIYGINAGVTYKNFDLNVVLSGISGLKLLNGLKLNTSIMATGHNASTDILDRWRKPGDVAALPRIGQNATGNGNLRPSDWWLEDGSYLRLRNITIGYNAPVSMLTNITKGTVKSLRIYVAAQNLVTITNYTGYDPEIAGDYLFARGIDQGQVPQPKTFLAGIQLGF